MTLRVDLPLVLLLAVALAFGTVMVASASIPRGDGFFWRHCAFLGLAMGALGAAWVVPQSLLAALSRAGALLALLLCALVLVPGLGREVNGSMRWLDFGIARLHVGEYAKMLMLLYVAGYLHRMREAHGAEFLDSFAVLARPFVFLALLSGLFLLQPDFGSVVVLGVSVCAVLFVAGLRIRHFLLLGIGLTAVFYLIAVAQPYRLERLATFTDPWAFAFGSGYQLTQALIAFGRGGYWGLGLGEGVQKLFYLPEAHNDFIFAVVAEELGLVGALALVLLFCVLVLRILRVARVALSQERWFAGYLCAGIGVMLGVQAMTNLGVSTGLLPTKGLTLPFISYGGHSLIVCCAMFGLVLRVASDNEANDV